MCSGDEDVDVLQENDFHPRILSIAEDIVFLASNGRKQTPKHIGLGIAVHQATRSKELVELLHSAGHTISYEGIRRVDTSIASDVLA